MTAYIFITFCVFGCVSKIVESRTVPILTQPEQVHLSYGENPTEMVVTWVTQNLTSASVVEYGRMSLDRAAKGDQVKFVDGGEMKRTIYVHTVTLRNLIPGQRYWYHCGGPDGWSDIFFFSAMKDGTNWSPRFALFGDMGNENPQSLTRLQEETQRNRYDAIFHVGDFAYDMDVDNGKIGDAFMNQIQPVAAYLPYMTAAGNHEYMYNFSHYVNRFRMPGSHGKNLFYSVNVGPIHFIIFSSEMYYFPQYGIKQLETQFNWFLNDLKEANRPENRAVRPWIITMCHRPMYCSNAHDKGQHCHNVKNKIRVGINLGGGKLLYGMEDVLYKFGVDLHIQAHEHSYERMWPVYNRTVCNGTSDAPYTDPGAPVHIVTGSAGCKERVDPFVYKFPWSAFRSDDYGYTRMNVYNSSHVYLEQVSDDKGGAIIDKIWLIKHKHGPFSCHPRTSSDRL